MDMFRRIPKDYRTSSYLGGLLTTVCCCVLTLLVLLEFQAYLSVTYSAAVMFPGNGAGATASQTYQPFVSLRFNVTFPHLPCEYMSAEMFDVYGRHAITNSSLTPEKPGTLGEDKVSMTIFKWRVVDEGKRRAGAMQAHVEGNKKKDGSETVHEELPYHHAAHQYRDVVPLTTSTFDTFVQSKDVVMVDFYAPWCIWCKRLAPVWENFAHEVTTKDYAEFVGVAKVDCTTETPLCQRRRITGYPSVFLYRDRNPHSHTPYQGDRTTTAFLQFIEGLGVETDHKAEIEEELSDVKVELEAEARRVRLAKNKVREDRADSGVNHPLKSLTAPGGALGPSEKGDAALVGILRALEKAGGSRGQAGALRIVSGEAGNIRVISVRPVEGSGDKAKKDKPLEFHTKSGGGVNLPAAEEAALSLDKVKQERAKAAEKTKPVGEASGDITVKILPSASDVKKRAEEVAEDQKQKGEATVPDPGLGGADPNKKDDKEEKKNGGGDDAAEGGGEEKTGATKAAVAKTAVAVEEAAATIKAKTGNRRRRLLGVEDDGEAAPQKGSGGEDEGDEDEGDKNRIADSELESRAELFKNTKSKDARQKMWKERVLPLPKDQQRKFTEIVGGAIFAPDGSEPKKPGPCDQDRRKGDEQGQAGARGKGGHETRDQHGRLPGVRCYCGGEGACHNPLPGEIQMAQFCKPPHRHESHGARFHVWGLDA
jgi:protein disulfide-isomerase-like protein